MDVEIDVEVRASNLLGIGPYSDAVAATPAEPAITLDSLTDSDDEDARFLLTLTTESDADNQGANC